MVWLLGKGGGFHPLPHYEAWRSAREGSLNCCVWNQLRQDNTSLESLLHSIVFYKWSALQKGPTKLRQCFWVAKFHMAFFAAKLSYRSKCQMISWIYFLHWSKSGLRAQITMILSHWVITKGHRTRKMSLLWPLGRLTFQCYVLGELHKGAA